MRSTWLKCISFMLATVTALSVLSGCDREDVGQTAPPTTTAQPTTQPVTQSTTQPVTEPPTEPTEPPTEYVGLTMAQPLESSILTWEDTITLSGTCDPAQPVFVAGTEVTPNADGSFTCQIPLEMGKQEILVTHKQEQAVYTVERRYGMQFYTPDGVGDVYHNNQTVYFRVAVKQGSQLTVEFDGKQINMTETVDQLGSGAMPGYVLMIGAAAMPANNSSEVNKGPVTYTVVCDGITEVYRTPDLICQPKAEVKFRDPDATPQGYINVGSGYIVEIVDVSVETFTSKNYNDHSDPTYNYLPKGTVDYGTEGLIYDPTGEKSYRLLRCGVRVYDRIKNTPITVQKRVTDCYTGILPDHNEINVASMEIDGHHTYLTLDCLWKAPFFFDFEPQEYDDVSRRKYTLKEFDATYIDITFCYANQVTGDITIPEDHPLFASAELIQNTSDMTLRLYLKKKGGLYGWDAYYNAQNQLVFKFLNPVTVTKADNAYGADLTGVTIMLDVGHGGTDIGAAGKDARGLGWTEKERNLLLALEVKEELESIGATVIMNRTTGDEVLTQRERIQFLKEIAPDYCLCIHHNSSLNTEQNGFEAYYFTSFSQAATDHIMYATRATGIYQTSKVTWFPYYVSRQTICPIALAENGYMSNVWDLEKSINPQIIHQKAVGLTQGVVNYYLELSGLS